MPSRLEYASSSETDVNGEIGVKNEFCVSLTLTGTDVLHMFEKTIADKTMITCGMAVSAVDSSSLRKTYFVTIHRMYPLNQTVI